jgi:type IV secretory pathway TrbF-like protein
MPDKPPGAHLREKLAPWEERVPAGSRWRHRRSGRTVTVACVALDEATLTPVVVYREDGSLLPFVRRADVFCEEGRFERLVSV